MNHGLAHFDASWEAVDDQATTSLLKRVDEGGVQW